jgi:two-component system CheB/CheR fusion protein
VELPSSALRRELARAEQEIVDRERFLAALGHELRNLLSPALAIVSRLRGEASLGSGLGEDLARVERNLQDEARLIDRLLDLERIECGRLDLLPQEVDVTAVVARAAEILSPEGLEAAGLSFEIEAPRGPEPAWADPDRLAQVFRNLLGNAVKFTPAGGSIAVRFGRTDDGSLEVEVTDTGAGIDPEALPEVIGRFGVTRAAARDARAGLGLGLSISRSIVEGLGGELTVSSAGAGMGSTFTVRLPAMAARRESRQVEACRGGTESPRAPRWHSRPLSAHRPLRLLLIEDHQSSREALAELLEAMGHEVVTAGSVAEALAVAADRCGGHGSGIDLVICDNGLPDGTGVELMRRLVDLYRLPGIALTGSGARADVRSSLEAGFSAHLVKPLDIGKLRQAIDSLRAAD